MLQTLRQNAGSWIIKFLLLAIVVVFIFWGVGSFRSQNEARVALVNGQTISYEEYNKAYAMQMENLKQQFGEQLDERLLEMLNVKSQVLTELINNKLLTEEAQRLNFSVSEEELADSIRRIPAFQSKGVFDHNRYVMVLNAMKRTPEEFEALQKEAMLIGKLRALVGDSVFVSDREALEWFKYDGASLDMEYILFEPSTYKDITPAEDAVKAHYEEHRESYTTQPKVKVRYFRFSPDDYRSKITLDDEKVKQYYSEHQEAFLEPKTVEARHILISVPRDADPEVVEKKRLEAEKIMDQAKKGKDFAELAKKYSEDPGGKDNGGYLGAFRKEQMVQPFADAAFSLKAGDISTPVQTQFGWHIIKVEKVNPERLKSIEEATESIRKALTDKEAEYMASNAAETLYDATFDQEDLKALAETKSVKLLETDFFDSTGPSSGVAEAPKFAQIAFGLEKNDISQIEAIGPDFFILQVTDKKPSEIPPFEAVKDKVRNDLVQKLQDEKAKKEGEALLAKLKNQDPKTPDKTPEGALFNATGFFKRNQAIPSIGAEKELSEAAFALTADHPLCDRVIKGAKGYYVIRFKERKVPDEKAFDLEKDDLKKNLLVKKQRETFGALVEKLKKNAEISIKEGFN